MAQVTKYYPILWNQIVAVYNHERSHRVNDVNQHKWLLNLYFLVLLKTGGIPYLPGSLFIYPLKLHIN